MIYRRLSTISLLLLFLLCASCFRKPNLYFKDFDPVKQIGIEPIDTNEKDHLNNVSLHYYQPVYYQNKLDSLYIFNISDTDGKPSVMKLKVFEKEGITIYETAFRFKHDSFFATPAAYYVIYPHEAAQYVFVPYDGWYINVIKPDTAYGGYKLIRYPHGAPSINDIENNGFRDSIFANRKYDIRDMPGQKALSYSIRLNADFSFNKWLTLKEIRE